MSASASATVAKPVKKDSVPEIIAASMVGTAIEFYDNYCYSIAAASYFGAIFFTDVAKSNQALATLMAFVTFAVSFLARPFGSIRPLRRQARPQEDAGHRPDDHGHRHLPGRMPARL